MFNSSLLYLYLWSCADLFFSTYIHTCIHSHRSVSMCMRVSVLVCVCGSYAAVHFAALITLAVSSPLSGDELHGSIDSVATLLVAYTVVAPFMSLMLLHHHPPQLFPPFSPFPLFLLFLLLPVIPPVLLVSASFDFMHVRRLLFFFILPVPSFPCCPCCCCYWWCWWWCW